jgi:hypothetical protein
MRKILLSHAYDRRHPGGCRWPLVLRPVCAALSPCPLMTQSGHTMQPKLIGDIHGGWTCIQGLAPHLSIPVAATMLITIPMTQKDQKANERRTLDSVLAALGLQLDNEPQEGETPDFTFDHSNRTVGVEVTMYRSDEIFESGFRRRQLESEWECLWAASVAFRNSQPDIKDVNVFLKFDGPVVPKREHPAFMEEIASFIRQRNNQLGPENILFGPRQFTTSLMKKYLDALHLRKSKCGRWQSNLSAGFVARPGPKIAEIVAQKSQKAFPAVDELWLAIEGNTNRISELVSTSMEVDDFDDVPSLESYKFSKVFVLTADGAYEWSRGHRWRKLTVLVQT